MNDVNDDRRPAGPGLREVFPAPTLDQWRQECLRLLKGVPFEKQMRTPTYEGVTLEPLYTREDLAGLPAAGGLPGFAPYARGTQPLGYRQRPWEVAQELPLPTCEEFNAALRHDLARGQTAAVLIVDRAGQAGLDPDQAAADQVGRQGTSVASLDDLRRALDGVDLAAVPVHVESGSAALMHAALLVALARERGVPPGRLRGSVGLDPVAGLAELGRLPLSLDQAYDELAILTAWARDHEPGLQTVAVRGHVYHDAGASAVQELALCLATAVHHLRELERRDLQVEVVAPRIRCHLSVGTHFFLEIARLRAARLLWSRVIEAAGGGEDARRLTLAARTSRFSKTVLDPHVNILRATTEAMAAILGQVDSLHVSPFDEPLGLPGDLARRLARNTQTILREESHFDQVVDPAGGSWCVETLTHQLAEAVWGRFQEIEAAGGVVAALRSGLVQERIAETAQARRRNLAVRKDVLVGTNRYPNVQEKLLEPRPVDHAALHAARSRRLQEWRTGGTSARNTAVLAQLAGILEGERTEVFARLVQAVQAGATVGELSRTFRHDADPPPAIEPLVAWRAGEMFERLRLSVRAHPDRGATTVFCANLGDVARYMPRLDFTRSFFECGGFAVEADRWFHTPQEVGDAAMQTLAATAVLVGLDATYAEQAVEAARQLKDAGVQTVLLAGQPGELEAELRAAGVDGFIHLRADAHAVLGELAASKGVTL